MRRRSVRARAWRRVAVLGAMLVVLLLTGCALITYEEPAVVEARITCGGADCHAEVVEAYAAGPHAAIGCAECHGFAAEHAADPKATPAATIDWRVDSCARCHETIATTYLYDDNVKLGPFGGSQREPAIPKVEDFPLYNTIVAGHGFTRDYREEGAHRFALYEHYYTLRGKDATCVQCKSTEIAWAWSTGATLTVPDDTTITLTHTKTEDMPARQVVVPLGTTVRFATDWDTHEVDAVAEYPDGRTFTSRPAPGEDALEHQNMLWAATMAATMETMPYGIGCTQCHDPHGGSLRILRGALLEAIEREGSVNPYYANAAATFETARTRDRRTLLCAQCHVEYTGGRSGVDGVVRDHFGWSKAAGLHDEYMATFDYAQDWTHEIIGSPLIKSQHPEVELFWGSPHYTAGASCASCHLPRVRALTGEWVRSHWFTSPYKYGDQDTFSAFARATGLHEVRNPCMRCHADRTALAIEGQQRVYERQKEVQKLLATSVGELGRLREAVDAGIAVNEARHAEALEAHRKAHVLWENLIVSENSMGFHNFGEVMDAMDTAEAEARAAIAAAREALPAD